MYQHRDEQLAKSSKSKGRSKTAELYYLYKAEQASINSGQRLCSCCALHILAPRSADCHTFFKKKHNVGVLIPKNSSDLGHFILTSGGLTDTRYVRPDPPVEGPSVYADVVKEIVQGTRHRHLQTQRDFGHA